MRFILVCFAFVAFLLPAHAQEQEEKSRFVRLVEDQISTDTFQIRLNGLEGSLSSNVSLESITIADQEGVYLRIVAPQLEWNRSALLRGKLDVESLTAQRIEYLRPARADDSLPDPEAQPFAIPDLPVSVEIDRLDVGEIVLTREAVGLDARVSLQGAAELDDGVLDVNLNARRLDGPGGTLRLVASYGGAGERVNIDVALDEPAGGIAATLLGLEGTPPVALTVKGEGALANLQTDIRFAVDGREVVGGQVVVNDVAEGRRIVADVGGPLASILPANLRPFVGGTSDLDASVLLRSDGSTLVENLRLDSGSVDLAANAFLLADGFLSALNVDLDLKDNDGQRVTLNLADSQLSLADGKLSVRYDAADRDGWRAELTAADLRSPDYSAERVDLVASGTVRNLREAARRAITFDLDGTVAGIGTSDPALKEALGERITLAGSGRKEGQGPLVIQGLRLAGGNFDATADGQIEGLTYQGELGLRSANLDAFSALAGRDLGGGADLAVDGTLAAAGTLDITVDGTTNDLRVGIPQLRPLLEGTTRLSGGVARGPEGLVFRELSVRNEQIEVDLDGRFATTVADLTLDGRLSDIGLLLDNASGAVTFQASVMGDRGPEGNRPVDVRARIALPNGQLVERNVENLQLAFDGQTTGAAVNGALSASGFLGGEEVSLAADIDASAERQQLDNLNVSVGATRIEGNVLRNAEGLLDGRVEVRSDDVSALAALAATEASGALNGTVTLSIENGQQRVEADVEASNLEVAGNRVGSADIEADVRDAFGRPVVDANVEAADIRAGGVEVRSVQATATTEGNRTAFDARAELAQQNARIEARGAVVREGERTTVELESLNGTASGAGIRLGEPTSVTLENGVTSFDDLLLRVGEGSVRLSGSVGEELNIDASIDRLPLDVANAVVPDLGLGGTVSGQATVRGTAASPDVTFDVTGADLIARQLREAGVEPLDINAEGTFQDQVLRLEEARLTNPQGVEATVAGTASLAANGPLDLDADIANLPLALANVAAPELGLQGRASGTASVEGTLQNPQATFDVQANGVSAAATREADVAPLELAARGAFRDRVLQLERATITNAQGVDASVTGTVSTAPNGAIDLDADIANLPLALANVAAPEIGLQGRASGTASVEGTLQNPQATFDVRANDVSAEATRRAGVAPFEAVAQGSFRDQTLTLDSATVTNPQGLRATASGTVSTAPGGRIDLQADVNGVPLSLANVAAPELGLRGTASGTATVGGTLADIQAEFDVSAQDVSANVLEENGVAPIAVDARGTFADQTVDLERASVRNGQGLDVSASGTVPIDGRDLSVSVSLDALPLSLANAARPELGLGGNVTGSAQVTGPVSDPQVRFDLQGRGVTAAQLELNGIDPVSLDAAGTYGGGGVTLDRATVSNGQGIDVSASGRVPLDGGALDVRAQGTAPLSLIDTVLAERGTRGSGTVRFNATVGGTLANPQANGLVSLSNGTITDPLSNLRLDGVGALASLQGDRVVLNRVNANLASGGSVSVSGSVGIQPPFPADLAIRLNDARYTDAETFTTTASGTLRVSGALLQDPLLSGTVNLDRTEITVPESFGGSDDLLEVVHVQPTPAILATLARLEAVRPKGTPTGRPSILNLDVQVNAPRRIFVRGRGLDAELGGSVRVRGPANDVRPVGSFSLIRGRLNVIGRRFVLDEGRATLTGDLNPFLDFRAEVQADGVLAFIIIRGRANDLKITFESQPALPEDEVLAQIVFGRALTDLSPAQIARLASIAAELTGGNSPGLVDRIRAGTGLDDLDVVTTASGDTAVRGGRYISDNVYVGVQAGKETEATINLDITRNLTAKGSVGTSGESEIGIFFKKDY